MHAFQALKEYSPDEAKVLRSGQFIRIHASELVPGDIIAVSVGDRVPADCRIISISSKNFRVDQAILTGESVSVNKSTDVVLDLKAVKQDMSNILFSVSVLVRITHQLIQLISIRAPPSSMEVLVLSSLSLDKKQPLVISIIQYPSKSAKKPH